jgi:hypothetical protein
LGSAAYKRYYIRPSLPRRSSDLAEEEEGLKPKILLIVKVVGGVGVTHA